MPGRAEPCGAPLIALRDIVAPSGIAWPRALPARFSPVFQRLQPTSWYRFCPALVHLDLLARDRGLKRLAASLYEA